MHRFCINRYFLTAYITGFTFVVAPAWGQVTNEDLKLLPKDGAANEEFGWSIDVDNGIVAVGAHQDSAPFTNSGAAYLFDASTGVQIFKLIPNDGTGGDLFGESIGISGGVVAVSAIEDDPNGFQSGSAYIFNASTGVQIAKIFPDDGGPQDDFGFSIAIDNGIVVVGATSTDDNGSGSGSVYLFNASDGTQIREIHANDAGSGDRFGYSVAISNGIIAVGAIRNDDQGSNSGAAYLFNAFTGAQIFKLLPSDGASSDFFGWSIAIDSSRVVVGVPQDDNENGSTAGSAYLFDISTGFQIAKLIASDGAGGDNFGNSVAVDSGVAVIGSLKEDEGASNGGAVYLFDTDTGEQVEKLLASDAASSDSFGQSVAINGGFIVVGSYLDDDNGSGSGSAYIFKAGVDTDGDGLSDDWETDGIPYTDGSGVEQRFMLPGADPMHKDLYVEVDAMAGLSLSSAAVTQLQTAFANSPMSNPDGVSGINLHILQDDTALLHLGVWQTDGCWPLDFDTFRFTNYGTLAERGHPDREALLDAKSKAYRYCIVADKAGPDEIGGCGQRPGDNFVIFIGGGGYNSEDEAAVFLHELGHNLNLRHGGGDSINGKPNYPSVMNYSFSYRYGWNRSFWMLDYSRQDAGNFVSLDETMLDETVGVGTPTGFYKGIWLPYGIFEDDGAGNDVRKVKYLKLDGRAVDFGSPNNSGQQDGIATTDAVQDLNYVTDGDNVPPGIPDEPSFSEIHLPHDDWANISLQLAAAIGPGAPAPTYATDELTNAGRDWVETNLAVPAGVCQADFTGDGVLNFFDVSAFLNGFMNNDPIADLTGDDRFNFFDVSAFLMAFSAGCP